MGPEPPVSGAGPRGSGLVSLPAAPPPTGFLDWVPKKMQRVGCVELLNTVQRRVQPRLHVFGHIHEGQCVQRGRETALPGAAHWPFSGHLPLTSHLLPCLYAGGKWPIGVDGDDDGGDDGVDGGGGSDGDGEGGEVMVRMVMVMVIVMMVMGMRMMVVTGMMVVG